MQNIVLRSLIVFLITLIFSAGGIQAQELSEESVRVEKLERAFDNLDLLWELGLRRSEIYAEAHNAFTKAYQHFPGLEVFPLSMPYEYSNKCVKFQSQQNNLVLTEECEHSDHELETLIHESYQKSQTILARYYLENFHDWAREIKEDLHKAASKEPDSALADFIPRINTLVDYADKLEEDPLLMEVARIVETQIILKDTEILIQFEQKIRQTLKNDISFAPGKYRLSDFTEEGKEAISKFSRQLFAIKKHYPLRYPGQPLVIKIKTVGYTDQVPVTGKALIDELLEGVDRDAIPQESLEQRKFLNQRLSEFRARTVNEYARERLEEDSRDDTEVQIVAEIVGKGEEFPSKENVSPAYLRRDPRRRICKISVTFSRQPLPF